MKFLLDQDVYATTVRFLIELGHDVIPVAQIGLAQARDEELLRFFLVGPSYVIVIYKKT